MAPRSYKSKSAQKLSRGETARSGLETVRDVQGTWQRTDYEHAVPRGAPESSWEQLQAWEPCGCASPASPMSPLMGCNPVPRG